MKIRYYGILSNRNRKIKLKRCRELLEVVSNDYNVKATDLTWQELLLKITGIDPRICPVCGEGKLILVETINPTNHAPPKSLNSVA